MLTTVERAVRVLELLAERKDLSVSELATLVRIDKSNASRLLQTLQRFDYVRRIPTTGRYGLGPAVVHLAQGFLRRFELREMMRPYLRRLYEATHETVTLVVEQGERAIFVDKLESPHSLRTHVEIGQTIPMHAGSTSKALMAHLPRERQLEILEAAGMPRLTANTIVDREQLFAQLDQVRRRGYATSVEETGYGAGGVAAAVLNSAGEPVAAIGVGWPIARVSEARLHEIGKFVRDVAAEASVELGRIEVS
jgi:IclR family KDG regulon transcriptional repressor